MLSSQSEDVSHVDSAQVVIGSSATTSSSLCLVESPATCSSILDSSGLAVSSLHTVSEFSSGVSDLER